MRAPLALSVSVIGLGGCGGMAASQTDIASFETRAEMCAHWGGEVPYNPARASEIARALKAERCETLIADGAQLRRANQGDTAIIARIDTALSPFL